MSHINVIGIIFDDITDTTSYNGRKPSSTSIAAMGVLLNAPVIIKRASLSILSSFPQAVKFLA